jgi:uncharacterized protein YecT (DUF1311 family)
MRWTRTLLLLAPLLWGPFANAREGPCTSPTTAAEAACCEAFKLKADEQALNEAYRRLLKELEGGEPHEREARATLIRAQRHWVAFREQDCLAKLMLRGDASLRYWYQQDCLREHARLRTRQLNDFRMD